MFKPKVIGILFVVVIAATLAHAQPIDSLPEKYVKKILFEAKWGSGPGEFGKEDKMNEMGLHYGPTDISADGKGNIYIIDFLNDRLQILSRTGNLISKFKLNIVNEDGNRSFLKKMVVDNTGGIYLLWKVPVSVLYGNSHLKTLKYEVRKYDWNGKILNSYMLPDEFFTNRVPDFVEKSKIQAPKEAVQEFGGPVDLRIAGDNVLLENLVIFSKTKGFLGANSAIENDYPIQIGDKYAFCIEDRFVYQIGDKKVKLPLPVIDDSKKAIGGYTSTDIYRNLYFGLIQIAKYSPDGKLLAFINTPEKGTYGAVYARYVDVLGNIYAMENDKSGLRIIKYVKQ